MASMLFWNIAKNKSAYDNIKCLVENYSIDILFLAECPENISSLLSAINGIGSGNYRIADPGTGKIRSVSRLQATDFYASKTNLARNMTIWNLRSFDPKLVFVQIAATHLPSKIGGLDPEVQAQLASKLSKEIRDYEDAEDCWNTILIGDFNMSPYETGVAAITGLGGCMTNKIAQASRTFQSEEVKRFYNPMWGYFGDRTEGPAGTYYWSSSSPNNQHWYIFDQILLRPCLVDRLVELRILDNDGVNPLVNPKGVPTKDYVSDHLPLYCILDI